MQCNNSLKCHTPQATSTRLSKARQERDTADTIEVIEYLPPRSPFGGNSTLHSIASGITADATVNCDCCAKKVRHY